MTTRHSASKRARVEGLTESNNVIRLITSRLAVEVMRSTNYLTSKYKIQEMHVRGRTYDALYLVEPQLAVKEIRKHEDPKELLKNHKKLRKIKLRTYRKLRRFIVKKESYALIESLLASKQVLLQYQAKFIHLYSPYELADLGTMHVAQPDTRKGVK